MENNLRQLTPIDGNIFHWKKNHNLHTGFVDMSDLPKNSVNRVFTDSYDIGFFVKGKQKTLLFTLKNEIRDSENEVTQYVFVCTDMPNVTINVFND
jgi:fatty-acid desaturase